MDINNESFQNEYESVVDKLQYIGEISKEFKSRSYKEIKEVLEVQERKSAMAWRNVFSKFMKWFLIVQYSVILLFLFLQGFKFYDFHLDNYIFYILIGGTLVQSYFLVRIIFKYLFSSVK